MALVLSPLQSMDVHQDTSTPELAQAARFRAAARASGSGGGPWADPPRDTSGGTLSHFGPGLPSGPSCDA